MSLTTLILLFVAFQVKHFLADFPLQNQYMLGKGKDSDWELPLFSHVLVHAFGTFLVTAWFGVSDAICFALFDACIHWTMDRIKADKRLLGRYNPSQKQFWNALGFDQMIHHLTGGVIIFYILYRHA